MSEPRSEFIDPSRQHRASHRARMHAEAHLQEENSASAVLNHPMVSKHKPVVIESDAGLTELLSHLRQTGGFAYDSEFIGELTYVPKLCLIQVATTDRIALIDPLAQIDLMPFWQLIGDSRVEKIVHAGEQDVEPVIRITGMAPANLIDTQVLAAFAGLAYPASLQKLVAAMLDFKLGKGLTFTHWDQRPLSAMQLRYAADDVRYLPALAAELRNKTTAMGNLDFAVQECRRRSEPAFFQTDPNQLFLKIRGVSNLSRTQLAVLRELCIWRNTTAQEQDIPTRALLKDDVLLGIVKASLKSEQDVTKVHGLPRPVAARFGPEIFAAVCRAHELPADQRPVLTINEEGARQRFEIDSFWARVQCACYDRGIDPAVVASRQQIADLYWQRQSGQAAVNHPLIAGWRGRIVSAVIKGN